MKFKFSYQRLLEHRETLKDIAQREYAKSVAKVDSAKQVLENMYSDIEEARKRALGVEQSRVALKQPGSLVQIHEFITGHFIRIERQKATLRTLMQESERLQQELVLAAREVKTLDRLKERKLDDFKLKAKRRELKEADEIVTTRFKRTENS